MFRLAVRLAALGAFCGGPLYLSDLLRTEVGQNPAFAIAFAPLGLLIFGLLTVFEEAPTGFARAVVGLGLVGAVGVLAMCGFAAWELTAGGALHPNRVMILGGSAIGLAVGGWYVSVAVPYVVGEDEPSP